MSTVKSAMARLLHDMDVQSGDFVPVDKADVRAVLEAFQVLSQAAKELAGEYVATVSGEWGGNPERDELVVRIRKLT